MLEIVSVVYDSNGLIEIIRRIFSWQYQIIFIIIQGPPTNFFLENAKKKKTTEYFLKFLFLFESTILPVNNGK